MPRVRVARKAIEAQDICVFEFVPDDGSALPAFSAGSHIDVHVPGGPVRQYSLCNNPSETQRYQVAVLREPASRGGSRGMHDSVLEGQLLEISEPRNHFALAHEARHSVLMAGGIGITPILCMAERLAVLGASFEMHYCTRSKERAAFASRIIRSSFADRVRFHFDDGPAEQRLDLSSALATQPTGSHLYVCGPKGFIDAVLGSARAHSWPEKQLHWESFTAAPIVCEDDGGFAVRLASSGRVVAVARDQTVVAALQAAGVEVPTSCEQGICGTCVTRVLDGVPDHRDSYLTPDEQAANDQFTPCCSRAKSACLVLDL